MAQSMRALARVLRTALPAAGALSGGTVLHCTDDGPPRLDDQRALLKWGGHLSEAIDVDASEVQQQRPPQGLDQCDLTLDDGAPRWELWVVTNTGAGRQMLFVRVDHCCADGIALVQVLNRIARRADVKSLLSMRRV